MATSPSVVLITGANSGIGFELAAQLMKADRYHVLVGSRSIAKGEAALADLQSRGHAGTCELVQLDVTDDESIARAVEQTEAKHGHLDCLVNNAAIASWDQETRQQMRDSLETNAIGVHFLTEAFIPLLQKAPGTARIINVSSGAGSISKKMDHSYPVSAHRAIAYRTSKAALNMVTACWTYDLRDTNVKVLSYTPGFIVSNLSSMNTEANGAMPAAEGVKPLVELVGGSRDGEVGKFLRGLNETITW